MIWFSVDIDFVVNEFTVLSEIRIIIIADKRNGEESNDDNILIEESFSLSLFRDGEVNTKSECALVCFFVEYCTIVPNKLLPKVPQRRGEAGILPLSSSLVLFLVEPFEPKKIPLVTCTFGPVVNIRHSTENRMLFFTHILGC